jgi:hypothetical protein
MKWFKYLSIAVVTFVVFIAVMAPASLLLTLLEDQLKHIPNLKIGNASGSLWNGQADLQYSNLPATTAMWSLKPLSLFTGTLAGDVRLSANGLDATFNTSLTSEGGELADLNADIESRYINTITMEYGLDLSEQFQIRDTSLTFDTHWITSAAGDINWPGGLINIETPVRIHSIKLPPMIGLISSPDQILQLEIAANELLLLTAKLQPDGWAQAAVSFDLMNMAQLPIPGNPGTTGSAAAVLIEEKVF